MTNTGLSTAATFAEDSITLQGNFDPAKLLLPVPQLKTAVQQMLREFGISGYIANLGHGILPNVPVYNARAFVDTVKEFDWSNL